jgi:hypothetical protein
VVERIRSLEHSTRAFEAAEDLRPLLWLELLGSPLRILEEPLYPTCQSPGLHDLQQLLLALLLGPDTALNPFPLLALTPFFLPPLVLEFSHPSRLGNQSRDHRCPSFKLSSDRVQKTREVPR